jgi:hypothetical protein
VPKTAISFRLTPEAIRLIKALAQALGIDQTAALEVAIREMASRKKVGSK